MISVVYLGKRGGGASFAKDIFQAGSNAGLVNMILLSSRNDTLGDWVETEKTMFIPVAHRVIEFLMIPYSLVRQIWASGVWAIKTRGDLILFVMPSPFDLLTLRIVKLFNSKIIFICHEINRHEGERWPNLGSIRKRIKLSAFVVTLSQSVLEEVEQYAKGKILTSIPHPIFQLDVPEVPTELVDLEFNRPVFLFVGRIKRYKGLDTLVSAWRNIDKGTLIIAGEGSISINEVHRVKLINRWLSDGEINYLMSFADVIVFPYSSASQSGLIPLVVNAQKRVIVSRHHGLMEQLNGHLDMTILVEPNDQDSLNKALNDCIETGPESKIAGKIVQSNQSILAFLEQINNTWSQNLKREDK
jgi:glycosyltransferase involved in cell wall biosynthesis